MPTSTSPPAAPNINVTQQQADGILDAYQTANNKMNATRDTKLLGDLETDSAYTIDAAIFKVQIAEDPKNKNKSTPSTFTNRTYTIPRLTAYPRWFVSHSTGTFGTKKMATDMVFVQAAQGAPWKVADEPDALMGDWNVPGVKPPAVPTPAAAVGPDGAAIALAPGDANDLAVDPDQLPALLGQAQAIGDSSADDVASRFRTFDAVNTAKQELAKEKKDLGNAVSFRTPPSFPSYPVYGVRTADGGAIVYTTTVHERQYDPPENATLSLSNDLAVLYGVKQTRAPVVVDYLQEFMVYIPAKGKGKMDVLQGMYYSTAVTKLGGM